MKTFAGCRRVRALLAAALLALSAPCAAVAQPADTDADVSAVRSFGEGDQKLFVVNHDGTWSMHAESLLTPDLLRYWHEAGGPEFVAKAPIDRPYTLSVHRLAAERIVERVLEGYGYTLHYDAKGRLERVRVYSLQPSEMFKTPRLVETLGHWRDLETSTNPAAAAAPDDSQSR